MPKQPVETKPPAPKAAALVAAQIRKQIVMGELEEGDLLPAEAEMLKRLGVSRPTLRQAFRILEAEHLITVQRGSRGGTVVHRPSGKLASRYLGDLLQYRRTTLGDAHRARFMIEPAAVAQLAQRENAGAIARLRDIVARQRAAKTTAEAHGIGEEFHIAVVDSAGNATLAEYTKLVHHLINNHIGSSKPAWLQKSADQGEDFFVDAHERLVELLEAGAAYSAVTHWREHLHEVGILLSKEWNLDDVLEFSG